MITNLKSDNENWFVLYTKPQQELKVAERLAKIGIESYCPYHKETRTWSDRKKTVLVPLIKSYVFVRVSEKERAKVFEVPGAVRYLFWLQKPAIATHQEINELKESLEKPFARINVENLKTGQQLIVQSGPFKDKAGEIIKINNRHVTVALVQLGFLLTIEY
ncbi:MAG: UpxY family transcription antiterminator [Flavobacteriaceae bacterium]|nr:UpxY family transcription antiterminator [Flavobacteriaceae bacterium]